VAFFFFCILLVTAPLTLSATTGWKKVALTTEKDTWYSEEVLGFSSKGSVTPARGQLKLVPAPASSVGLSIKRGLARDGLNPDAFHYFIESVEVDCKKKVFAIRKIDFFDSEDARISGQTFAEPKRYTASPGSIFEMIAWDFCQNKPGLLDTVKDTLKRKKPFLYLFPQGEPAK